MEESETGNDIFLKVPQSPAILRPSIERSVYQIIGIHNKQLNERGNDRRSNVRHAGETCRASPNFGDRCQRHRGAPFPWVGRQELSPRSDENPIYGIAGDKPYAFTSWAKKKQWERRLKGAMVVVRQKRAAMTPQRVTRPVEFPSLVRSPPTTTSNRRLLTFQPSGTRQTRLHDSP